MIRALVLSILLCLFLVKFAQADEKVTLHIGMTDACPHMCPLEEGKGFTAEIAKIIFTQAGYRVEFVNQPWNRAVVNTERGVLDAIISAGQEEAPNLIYPQKAIATQKDCFVGVKGDNWRPFGIESFRDRKTIVFEGWVFEQKYRQLLGKEEYEKRFLNLSLEKNYIVRSLGLIKRGRASSFWSDQAVFEYFKKSKLHSLTGNFEILGCIYAQNLFIGFSPTQPDLAKTLSSVYDQGIDKIRKSGELEEILKRYGLDDWEKIKN